MDSESLDRRATALVAQLTSRLRNGHDIGSMSPAIYDTAWLAMIPGPERAPGSWLFPQSYQYILDHQQADGSCPSYASTIDGILNTAASLLCLQKHILGIGLADEDIRALQVRIDDATPALQRLLNGWDVVSTRHVGFEVLVPALLEYLRALGIRFDFPQSQALSEVQQQKLRRFDPKYLYGKVQLTALHSLEAFIGKVDFDKLAHHKTKGFMASPSSTAAYLMHASAWDEECETYLKTVVDHSAGVGSGGVPSAFPSTTFEITWICSTLLDGGIDLSTIDPEQMASITEYLERRLAEGQGVTGFAPGLGADADDTAKSILILNSLGRPTSPESLIKHFEDEHCFKTYPLERDPSVSANINVLIALLHADKPQQWSTQISKIVNFIFSRYEEAGTELQDKWNVSPYYSMMLLAQAFDRLLGMTATGPLGSLCETALRLRVIDVLRSITAFTLDSRNSDGCWGAQSSREETAYAIVILAKALSAGISPELEAELREAIEKSRSLLLASDASLTEYLWVEKVSYGSKLLSEAYVLAALNLSVPKEAPLSSGQAVSAETRNTAVARGATPADSNMVNGHSKATHERTDSVLDSESEKSLPTGLQTPTSDTFETWTAENENVLMGPYNYLDRIPGKDVRGAFITVFNTWLHVPPERLHVIEGIVRKLHTASLLVDDIEDNSQLRRGVPVAHSVFGVPSTFNTANYVYFDALRDIYDLQNNDAFAAFSAELLHLHRGQGLDLYYRDALICPTEEEYLEMVKNKTGGLFRLAIRLMQSESQTGRDLVPLVDLLWLMFQIADDYCNLKSKSYTETKGYCEDLTEGKFSFPIIHSIRSDPTNKELENILKQKPREVDIKRYAVSYMEKTGSFEYTRQAVSKLKSQVLDMLDHHEAQGWEDAGEIRRTVNRIDIAQ